MKFIHTFIKNLSLTGWIDRSFKYTYFQVFNVKQTKEKVKTNLQYFMMQIKLIQNNYNWELAFRHVVLGTTRVGGGPSPEATDFTTQTQLVLTLGVGEPRPAGSRGPASDLNRPQIKIDSEAAGCLYYFWTLVPQYC